MWFALLSPLIGVIRLNDVRNPNGRKPRARVSLSSCSFHKDTDLFGSEYYFRLVVALPEKGVQPPSHGGY